MIRVASVLLVGLGCVLPSVAHAQGDPVDATLGKLLGRAQKSGALERVLGERWFKDPRGGRVRVRCDVDETKAELRCEVEFLATPGAMREERLRLRSVLGLDGRLHTSELLLVRGRDRVEANGKVADGRLVLNVAETRGAERSDRQVDFKWGSDCLPFGVALFVLPALADQGLPKTLRFRVFHPVNLALQDAPCELRIDGATLHLKDFVPNAPPTRIRQTSGKIIEIDLAGDRLVPTKPPTKEEKSD